MPDLNVLQLPRALASRIPTLASTPKPLLLLHHQYGMEAVKRSSFPNSNYLYTLFSHILSVNMSPTCALEILSIRNRSIWFFLMLFPKERIHTVLLYSYYTLVKKTVTHRLWHYGRPWDMKGVQSTSHDQRCFHYSPEHWLRAHSCFAAVATAGGNLAARQAKCTPVHCLHTF